jgi:hypothetical protein
MSDRVFYASAALFALALIALSLVWPQGEGARSPGPFGKAEITPSYVAAQKKKEEARAREKLGLKPGETLKPEQLGLPPEPKKNKKTKEADDE